jgi:hypothetical protein
LHASFVEKLFWGNKVCGIRVALDAAKPAVVRHLIRAAWINKAPKSVAASHRDEGEREG